MSEFTGFSEEGIRFLAELRDNNEREWFNARKHIYQDTIVAPAIAFIEALGERLRLIVPEVRYDTRTNGSGSMMRIYRDVRFSNDKSPYKTNIGIVFWQGTAKKTESASFYFHLSAEETWIGGGIYQFPKPTLLAYREAVDDDERGEALAAIVTRLKAAGYNVGGEQYKRVPRGYDPEHPRGELLKLKGLTTAAQPHFTRAQITSPNLVDLCLDHCANMAPLIRWLARL
jgi:uncharacterized protein (TIGR02453 family)